MELTHSFTVPASPQTTWDHFMDIGAVAECFPGAAVTSADDEGFKGTVKVKLGPIALQYAGSGTFVERDDAAHTATLQANGKDRRGNGTAGATVRIALSSAGEGTAVDVTTDLAITGKPAQFGRGVMQDVSDKLLGQFVACLEQRLAEEGAPAGGAADGGAEATASASGSAPAGERGGTDGDAASGTTTPGAVSGTEASDAAGAAGPAAAAVADATAAVVADATAPARPPLRAAPPLRATPPASSDDAIDLGTTVLPVLLRSYAPQLVAGLVGLLVGILIGRRRR